MKTRTQVDIDEAQEVKFEKAPSTATYWMNLKTNKVFKMNGNKIPKGKVKEIDYELFNALNAENTSYDPFNDDNKTSSTELEAFFDKPSRPFDLSSLPSEEDIRRMSVDSDMLMKELTENLLDKQRANMNSTMLESLNSLVFEAKNLDPASVNKKGLVGLFMKAVKAKEKFFSRYDTVKSKINALTDVLNQEKDKQIKLISNIDILERVNEDYARKINEELKNIVKVLDHMKNEIDKWPTPSTQEEANIFNKANRRIQLLEKREMDLNGFLALSAQMMPEISNLRENSYVLINNFEDLVGKVVPAYELNFSKFIMTHQQSRAIEISNKTGSVFNEAVRQNSDQSMKNTIEVEKLKHRPLVEIETLRHVHNNLVQTSIAVTEVIKQSKEKRERYLATVDNIGQSLIEMSKQQVS